MVENDTADRALQRGGGAGRSMKILASLTAVAALVVMAALSPDLEKSYTVHMIFHMILIGVFAPSLLAADLFLWWLPPGTLSRLAPYRVLHRVFYAISRPTVAFIFSTAVLWFWHIPIPYDATLVNVPVHILEHISLFIAFLAYWAPLIPGAGLNLPTIKTNEGKVLYLLAGAMQGMILGALITFQGQIIYHYPSTAHLPGITLLADQQMGGATMWFFGALIYTTAAILSLRSSGQEIRKDGSSARGVVIRPEE